MWFIDFVMLLDNKEECKDIMNKIEIFLKDKLKLELNTCIKNWHKLVILGKLDIKRMNLSINSIYCHIKHSNCYYLKNKIIKERNEILRAN